MTTVEKLSALRALMAQRGISAYLIPTDDFHASEYVGLYFKAREYLSGFTGSAGTLVVLPEKAALWTDGRYFLQAAEQLEGSTIELMRMGQPGVPTMEAFLAEQLPQGGVIGFDGRTVSHAFVRTLAQRTAAKSVTFAGGEDLVGMIWPDRPALSKEPVWELSTGYAGLSREEKLGQVREAVEAGGADALLLTALDEIAWLLNLRGNDVQCTPVFLSYMLLTRDGATLCANASCFSEKILETLRASGVTLAGYEDIYGLLSTLPSGTRILLDSSCVNERLYASLPGGVTAVEGNSPVALMKAVKTPAEAAHIRAAHVKDGVAVTRFIFWLQHTVGKEPVTELSASAKLERFRGEMEGYLGPSFDPIVAYGPHGAIVHYEPTEESSIPMEPHSFCLADTGGHYLDGTTDITRTIPLGPLTGEEKRAYTLVLKGHLSLGAARFPQGVTGAMLDCLARQPLWEEGLDYRHGTGHGVGYLLSVHEGPQRISCYGATSDVPLESGMVVSNEPGLYLSGKFGIRHENLVLCCKGEENDFGQFLYLDPLTMVPFDKNALDLELMSDVDLRRLNAYHQRVFETISPYLSGGELDWLRSATAPLCR